MKRWEYRSFEWPDDERFGRTRRLGATTADGVAWLNGLGAEGWEVVVWGERHVVAKREVPG